MPTSQELNFTIHALKFRESFVYLRKRVVGRAFESLLDLVKEYVLGVWEESRLYGKNVHNNPLLSLQPGILGILLGLKCGMVRDFAREVSLAQISCTVALPTLVGEWSMALVLWQRIEYY